MAVVVATRAEDDQPSGEVKGQLAVSFGMLRSFGGQASSYMKALAQITACLPPTAQDHEVLMNIINDQRLLTMQAFKQTAVFMGVLVSYEESFAMIVKDAWDVGQCADLSMQKINFKSALEGLKLLESERMKAKDAIDQCQGIGKVMKDADKQKMEAAVLEALKPFSGEKAYTEMAGELKKKMQAKNEAEKRFVESKEKLAMIEGKFLQASVELAYYTDTAAGEKIGAERLRQRCDDYREKQDAQDHEAANAANKKSSGGWFIFSWSSYDNKGDREQEKADRVRRFAQRAKEDAELQADKAGVAKKRLAEAESTHKKLQETLEALRRTDAEAVADLEKAVADLRAAEKRADKESAKYGGMSMRLVGELMGHVQDLPERLMAKSAKEGGMFAAMQGYLQRKEIMTKKMEAFLQAESDDAAVRAFSALGPLVRNAIENSCFVTDNMRAFQARLDDKVAMLEKMQTAARLQDVPQVGGATSTAVSPGVAAPAGAEAPAQMLKLQPDDDDDF